MVPALSGPLRSALFLADDATRSRQCASDPVEDAKDLAWVGEGAHGRRLAALREPSGVARGHNYRWSRVVKPGLAADVSSAPCSVTHARRAREKRGAGARSATGPPSFHRFRKETGLETETGCAFLSPVVTVQRERERESSGMQRG